MGVVGGGKGGRVRPLMRYTAAPVFGLSPREVSGFPASVETNSSRVTSTRRVGGLRAMDWTLQF